MKIGLLGAGNIGRFLLDAVNLKNRVPGAGIVSLLDERPAKKQELTGLCETYGCRLYQEQERFLQSGLDVVVESTDPETAKRYAPDIISRGIDMVIVSVGALVEAAFVDRLRQICAANKSKVYVPSGAIGGTDALRSANALGEIDRVTLTTRKPPAALSMELGDEQERLVFSGTAAEAIRRFPKNVNVAVTISLAGLGAERTMIEVYADARVRTNTHEIHVSGAFGQMNMVFANTAMPQNPKTSFLAALSALSTLQQLNQTVIVS